MRTSISLISIITVVFILQSFVVEQDKKRNKKTPYQFPTEMAADIQAQFAPLCDKGYTLYELNCAKCHSIKVHGKEVIPDFTQAQLKGYELRVLNAEHESDLPEENISPEELGYINIFLTYKKPNMVK